MLKDVRHSSHPPDKYGLPPEREAEAVLLNPDYWPRGIEPHMPEGMAKGSLLVEVNHGRWIVNCPCGSAQDASRTDRRFWCIECGNVLFDGKWAPVKWPSNAVEIEVELERRIFLHNRNWKPGETLEDLREEAHTHPLEAKR